MVLNQKRLNKQFSEWQKFLNEIVGFTAFMLALGSASLPNPFLSVVASILSFVILNNIIERSKDKFPRLYDKARKAPLKTKKDLAIIDFAKKELLHHKKYPVYMIGTLSLGGVLIGSLAHIPFYLGNIL